MKFIKQTKFNKEGNCLSACVASMLNIDIATIPDFKKDNIWHIELSDFLKENLNMFCMLVNIDFEDMENIFQDSIVITCINSDNPDPEVERHAVLSQRGTIVFDPNIGEISKLITKDLDPTFIIISGIY